MPTFTNPLPDLDDLIGFFEIAADEGGASIDADLCGMMVEALGDLADKFEALIAFARAHDCIQRLEGEHMPSPSPMERKILARAALAEAAGGTVVRFPAVNSHRAARCSEGAAS